MTPEQQKIKEDVLFAIETGLSTIRTPGNEEWFISDLLGIEEDIQHAVKAWEALDQA